MPTIGATVYTPDGFPYVFEGVVVYCTNLLTYQQTSQVTDSFGNVTFPLSNDGNYRLTPAKTGYVFNPIGFDCYLIGDASARVDFFSSRSSPPPALPLATQITAENIINRVRERLNDANDVAYPLSLKMEWIDSAQRDLALKMPVSALEKIIVTIPEALVAWGTGYIEMPNDFLKIVDVIYRGNPCRFIHSSKLKMVQSNLDLQDTNTEPIVFWENNNLRIKSGQYPSGNTETAKLIYVKIPSKITELTSVVDLDNFLDLIYFYSLAQGYGKDENNGESDKYMSLYLDGIKTEWQKELANRR